MWGVLINEGLLGPNIKNTVGQGVHNQCEIFQDLNLKNGVDFGSFVRKSTIYDVAFIRDDTYQ